ncbi:MAG: hypothetical protein K0R34_4403 [Herbinix sp.]|jgi:hypothetical protein|nr:hypothetical protein [Herbinix sp.]
MLSVYMKQFTRKQARKSVYWYSLLVHMVFWAVSSYIMSNTCWAVMKFLFINLLTTHNKERYVWEDGKGITCGLGNG